MSEPRSRRAAPRAAGARPAAGPEAGRQTQGAPAPAADTRPGARRATGGRGREPRGAGGLPAAPNRREQLLDAAETLLAERGLRALTVDDVTARAGVAKGTFYLYFAAKGDVLVALRERYVATMHAQHARAIAQLPPDDHVGRLDRWIAEAIGGHVAHERLHDALFHHDLPSLAVKTGVAPANPQLALLREILEAGVAAGAFALADAETTAVLLYGAMHAAVDLLLDGDRPLDVARVVRATQQLAHGAVGARPAARTVPPTPPGGD